MSAILGLSVYHADAAAAAVRDGVLVAGVEEERFRRVKHWAGFPTEALVWCARQLCDGDSSALDAVAVARQPRAYLGRKLALALRHPRSLGRAASRARNLAQVADLGARIGEALGAARRPRLVPVEHHVAHLASAYYAAPFDEAACLSVDGFGDFVSTMIGRGRGARLDVLERVHYPHSLGLFYTALTQYLGFPGFGDEYKVMGLAGYGEPRFARELATVAPASADGAFRLDLAYFRHLAEGVEMTWDDGAPSLGPLFTPRLEALLGPARKPDDELTDRHRDLAASLQSVFEERYFVLARRAMALAGSRRLALAGGCAMNSLANGKLFDAAGAEAIFVQPAAGDAGTALGAALWAHHANSGSRAHWSMRHAAWGPQFGESEIRAALAAALPACGGCDGASERAGERFEIARAEDDGVLCRETAAAISAGEVVGWFQGRAEWGPRALGHRSILADPRRSDMRELLNRKIKRREPFRPFAPAVLAERAGDWFARSAPDPFMTRVDPVRPEKRPLVPAVTHVDGTGRLQTVDSDDEPLFHRLISEFERATSIPLLLNTSFNENEPIVNTPGEAIDCFLRTNMDRLVLGPVVVRRA